MELQTSNNNRLYILQLLSNFVWDRTKRFDCFGFYINWFAQLFHQIELISASL